MDTEIADDIYQVELKAAGKNLNAQATDLQPLLSAIQKQDVAASQISGLVKVAYRHLLSVRQQCLNISGIANAPAQVAAEIAASLRQLQTLQNGGEFSLIGAIAALTTICQHLETIGPDSDMLARAQENRARLLAANQQYAEAAVILETVGQNKSLNQSVRWHLMHLCAQILIDYGREYGNESALEKAITMLRDQVLTLTPVENFPVDRATTQNTLGNALGVLGQRKRGTRYLEQSIEAFEQALGQRDCEGYPTLWSESQNNLGNALGALAQRQADAEMLQKSVSAFELALEQLTAEHTPEEWAITQNNLAAVLQNIGLKNKAPNTLKRAVDAYKAVLTIWTRDRVPLDWATTMNNLGTALRVLGEHRKGPRTLEQAVAAYNNALAERTMDRVPLDWAMTENNLGAALQKLAQRQKDEAIMQKALTAYERALTVWTKENAPMTWAMAMANLGVARREMAEMTGDIEHADNAVNDLKSAVELFRAASHANYTQLCSEQLSHAQKLVARLLEEAENHVPGNKPIQIQINVGEAD